MFVSRAVGFDHRVVEWRDRIAFAGDLGGDALKDFGGQVRVHQDRKFRLAEHIDEARRDYQPVCIDHAFGGCVGELPDGGDPAGLNRDVTRIPGRPRAVDDVAIADDEVVVLRESTHCE